MFTSEHIVNAKNEVDKVINLLKVEPEAYILDLCCGIGRHSLEMARRGFHVTVSDR